ncbi:unnamed protein product [Dicrocoelium dendriticum]|nr:unnamed protein product [Dicrocoelium dendriticum]
MSLEIRQLQCPQQMLMLQKLTWQKYLLYLLEVPKTVELCRHIEIKELNLKLSETQRELFKAISSAERSEALRQEAALELNHAELLNKRLLFFHEQQQQHINETEDRVKLAEQRYNQCIQDWNVAQEQWEKERTSLMEKLEYATNQEEFYRRSMDDMQGQLAAALAEKQALLETIDLLTAELQAVTNDRGDVRALMDAKLKEEQTLKLECQKISERNRHLEAELEVKQTQLTQLQKSLPVLLQVTLRQAVDRVHTMAKVQITKTHKRLEEVEHRLWQQTRQLRELESTNRFLKVSMDSLLTKGNVSPF